MPVTIDTSLPLHDDRDASWDGDAAAAAMAAACGGRGESLDVACMGEGFLWRDPEADETTLGAYKFPVADIYSGRKQIVWSGVTAAASYLERGEGIPDSDRARMRSVLEALYERFAKEWDDDSIRAPWIEQTASGDESDDGPDCDGDCGCQCGPAFDRFLTASGVDGGMWSPPRDWFGAGEAAPLTITPDGRVYGDLARFGQRHIGADGHDIYPPRDPDGLYRAFRQRTITCDNGDTLAVGVLTMDTGHAGSGIGAQAAVEHYDHTGAIVAAVNVGEDEGPDGKGRIWLAGALLPDVTDEQRVRLMLSGVSGDWRQTRSRGPLELVAALAVNVPGFPVPAVEVKDGREYAIVAAGAVIPQVSAAGLSDAPTFAAAVVDEMERRDVARREAEVAAARVVKARTAHAVMASCARRGRARRAQSAIVAALLANVDLDSDPDRDLTAQGGRFLDEQGRNWVEQTGGLPEGIRAVADELMLKGFGESHAIAVAVNVIKRWCWGAPDGLNWPGVQQVSPRTRARGCKNLLEWNLNRALARAT